MLKKFLKWTSYFLLFLLVLFLVAWGLLQLPKVQTRLVGQITKSLTSTLGTKVSIDRVDIKFFKTLSIEGIYLEDQQQDTLLYASSLDVNIGIFDLFGSEIFLNQVTLNDGYLNIYQHPRDTTLNINFLLETFAADPSANTVDTSSTATTWKLGINTLALNRSSIRFDDQVLGLNLKLNSTLFSVDLEALDLENNRIAINDLLLKNNQLTVLSIPQNQLVADSTTVTTPLVFPYVGWDINLDRLVIKETSVAYALGKDIKKNQGINFKDLNLIDLSIDLRDFIWREEAIGGNISQFSFLEKSGLQIDHFNSEIEFTPKKISIDNFKIKTPHSNFSNKSTLTFSSLTDLSTFTEKVHVKSDFKNTKIGIRDIELLAPIIGQTKAIDINALKTVYLNGTITGNTNLVKMMDTEIKVDQMLTLRLDGKFRNPTNPSALVFDLQLKEFSSSYKELNRILKDVVLPSGLARFGSFNLSGTAQGTMADFTASNLNLATELATGFTLNGRIQNAEIPEQLFLDINLENLITNIEEIGYLIPEGVPPNLRPLGTIAYTGKFTGGLTEMELVGELSTDIGRLNSDLKAKFKADYSDATYQGDLALNAFQLNKIIGDSLGVGEVTFSGKIDGSGISPETIQASIDANIDNFVYQDYEYENLKVDGRFDRKKFMGAFNIADPNITFDFRGLVDLNLEIPAFEFDMDIDIINLEALNFLDRDFKISGVLDFDFQATSIKDLSGLASMTDFAVSNTTQSYTADSVLLFAGLDEAGNNQLSLDAPFVKGALIGDFDLEELPTLILSYINDYFPLDDYLSPAQQAVRFADIERKQKFNLAVDVIDITPLQMFILPDLAYVETASLTGDFNSAAQTMVLETEITKVVYGANKFKKFTWKADGTNVRLTNDLLVEELEAGGNEFSEVRLANTLRQDSAYFQLDVMGVQDSVEKLIQLAAVIDRPEKAYEMRFADQFILNDKSWGFPSDNLIRYDGQQILINNLALKDGVHQLIINSETPKNAEVLLPDITIDFDEFKISEISNLIIPGNDAIGGKINGKVKVMEPTQNLYFTVDLEIPDLTMNKESVGAVTVDLSKSATSTTVDVNVLLKGPVNDLKVDGTYRIDSKKLDLNANLTALEMRLLDLVLVDVISDSKGTINGNISVKGTPTKPDVNGLLNLSEISTLIEFTQARYAIDEGMIELNNKAINLSPMTLKDTINNTAQLSGRLNHDFFTNITLDLNLDTKKFLILNTTAQDNPIFYGNLILGAQVEVMGPLELPNINVVANTLPGSELNLSPFAEGEIGMEEDYIIFGNPNTYVQPGDSINVYEAKASIPADVTLNLELTSDALLQIIVDPINGDRLKCRGTSDLLMRFLPSGLMEMFGTYQIDSGQYGFSYSEVVRRNFDIVPGGTVFFNGDPLNARFNVAAKYTTQAATYELIASEATLSSGEVKQAQKRQPISVVLGLEGNLAAPVLAFDIEVPEAQGNIFNSAVPRKLEELRNNPSELNKQVFGLLLINSFIVSSSSTNLGDVGENVVLSSVSKLFSNQLNSLAEKFIKGVEINFDLSSYKSEYANAGEGGTVTELGVGFTKQLFNDRVSLTAGGSFEVQGEAGASQVAGDFLLTYELTSSGKYLLKVFRRSDYDVINEESAIKTGLGISFKKAFDEKIRQKEKTEKKTEKENRKIEN